MQELEKDLRENVYPDLTRIMKEFYEMNDLYENRNDIEIFVALYVDDEELSFDEIAIKCNVVERTLYRFRKKCIAFAKRLLNKRYEDGHFLSDEKRQSSDIFKSIHGRRPCPAQTEKQ